MSRSFSAAAAVFLLLAASSVVILPILLFNRPAPKNDFLTQYEEIQAFKENNPDFDKIVSFIEGDDSKKPFLKATLEQFAQDESAYGGEFEARYPRYKEFRDMERELAAPDFSPWIASVIAGDTPSNYEHNVFEYLAKLEDDRYLDQAITRFFKIASSYENNTQFDEYALSVLFLYLEQFSDNKTFRAALNKNKKLIQTLANEDEAVLNNKVFYYLSLKYFGMQSLIKQRLATLEGKERYVDGHPVWNLEDIRFLINDFVERGKGMAQYFYPLFDFAFEGWDPNYAYIALNVFREIGYDDPALLKQLDRNYSRFKFTIYHSDEQIRAGIRQQEAERKKELRAAVLKATGLTEADLVDPSTRRMLALMYGIPESDLIPEPKFSPLDMPRWNMPDFRNGLGMSYTPPPEVIDFPGLAANVREAVKGRQKTDMDEQLKSNSIEISGQYFVPPVQVLDEIQSEFAAAGGITQYTQEDIMREQQNYALKETALRTDVFVFFALSLAASLICILLSCTRGDGRNLLVWLPSAPIALVILGVCFGKDFVLLSASSPVIVFAAASALFAFLLRKPLSELSGRWYALVVSACGG